VIPCAGYNSNILKKIIAMVFMQGKALGQEHSLNNQPSTLGLIGLLILGMPLSWGFSMHFLLG
jgi:hypothetical protein